MNTRDDKRAELLSDVSSRMVYAFLERVADTVILLAATRDMQSEEALRKLYREARDYHAIEIWRRRRTAGSNHRLEWVRCGGAAPTVDQPTTIY